MAWLLKNNILSVLPSLYLMLQKSASHACFPGKILAFIFSINRPCIYFAIVYYYANNFPNSIILWTKTKFPRLIPCFANIVAGECQYINEQYTTMESNICMYKKHIYNVKSTLQKVLACWATYMEKLRSLKACFEETKKEQIKEVFAVQGHLLGFHFSLCLVWGPSVKIQRWKSGEE